MKTLIALTLCFTLTSCATKEQRQPLTPEQIQARAEASQARREAVGKFAATVLTFGLNYGLGMLANQGAK